MNDAGDGLLKVSLGWVAFQYGDHESFIPAGAECATRNRTGPAIPYYADSSDGFRDALGRFERGDGAAVAASARDRGLLRRRTRALLRSVRRAGGRIDEAQLRAHRGSIALRCDTYSAATRC